MVVSSFGSLWLRVCGVFQSLKACLGLGGGGGGVGVLC